MHEPLPVLSWVRVSSLGQVYAESPENHELENQCYAEDNNLQIVAWIRLDGISGTESLSHPEAARMLHLAKTGQIRGVLFTQLTRFGRDMVELVMMHRELEKYGVALMSVRERIDTSTVSGLDQFYNLARAAEIEIRRLSERVRRGLAMRRRMGQITGRAPYGYRKVDRALEIDPIEGPIRAEMFTLYLMHRRIKTVATLLNDGGHRTRDGNLWRSGAVRRLLLDPTAAGRYISNRYGADKVAKPADQQITIAIPALVPLDVFERVGRLLEASASHYPAKKPRMAYSGLLYCHCGTNMYYRRAKEGKVRACYFCRSCGNRIRFDDLDQAIGKILTGFALDNLPATIRWEQDAATGPAGLLAAMQAEAAALERARTKLIELFQAEALSLSDFKARHQPLADRQAALTSEIQRIENQLAAEADRQADSAKLVQALAQAEWGNLELEEKAEILRVVIKKMVLTPDAIELIPWFLPERLILGDQVCKRGATPSSGISGPSAGCFCPPICWPVC